MEIGSLMNDGTQIQRLLSQKFDERRAGSAIKHFLQAAAGFELGDWEETLEKTGKFVEAVIKVIWVYAGKTLPNEKEFKAGHFAEKILNGSGVVKSDLPNDGVRLQIPRACVFLYDIASNRGGRHDSDEFDPSEMDAVTSVSISSWVLAELVRFSGAGQISQEDAQQMVASVIKRRYPAFEEIEDRIYVDDGRYSGAIECALMILYRKYPGRMSKSELQNSMKRHSFSKTALKFERLAPYVDIDANDDLLIRASGRRKVEEIRQRKTTRGSKGGSLQSHN